MAPAFSRASTTTSRPLVLATISAVIPSWRRREPTTPAMWQQQNTKHLHHQSVTSWWGENLNEVRNSCVTFSPMLSDYSHCLMVHWETITHSTTLSIVTHTVPLLTCTDYCGVGYLFTMALFSNLTHSQTCWGYSRVPGGILVPTDHYPFHMHCMGA